MRTYVKPKPGKLDMETIAQLLGVSKTTVHYAIRNTGRLSDETRKRVLKMVQAKGYRPDGLARSFRRRRSDTLGIVLATLTNSFHAHLLEGVEMVAQQYKHTVLVSCSHGRSDVERELVEFVKESRLTKPAQGHLAKNNLPPVKFMREVPLEVEGTEDGAVKVGDRVLVEIFDGERFVDIVGISKGRGFQGVVKRHHFAGGPKSHGSMFQITGSIGSSAFPSRVFKGMRMSCHMGNARVTVRNLRLLGVDKYENLLVVEGAVPGPKDGYVVIAKAKKPPRERRGFSGSATVDPLKAAKRAAKKA